MEKDKSNIEETISELQEIINILNQRFFDNANLALKYTMIVDPQEVTLKDLETPEPKKKI